MSCDLTNGRLLDECLIGRAGIKTLYFTKYNDFASLTGIIESGGEITDLGLVPINIYQFDLAENVGNFEESPTSSPENGTSFVTQNVTMTLFYIKPADLAQLNNLKRGRWTVWTLDFQGKIRLFGRTRGMVASGGSEVSGVASGDKKGFDLIFTAEEQDNAPFMADFTTVPFDNFANITVILGVGYSPEYQQVYNSFTTKPSDIIAAAQDAMVVSLVAAGVWAKLDLFYMFAQTTNGGSEALKNWVNPGTFNALLVNAPAFVALEGFTGNGTNSYINTGWNGNNDGIQYTLNAASIGVYTRTAPLPALKALAGAIDSSPSPHYIMIIPNLTNTYTAALHATSGTPAALAVAGLYEIDRTTSSNVILYQNYNKSIYLANNAYAIPIFDIYIGARNNEGVADSFANLQVSMMYAGGTMSDAQHLSLINAVEAYMDSNGKGVLV